MTQVAGTAGLGITLSLGSEIAQVKNIDGVDFKMGMYDSTCLSSAAKEYLPTILDAGEPSFTTVYTAASHGSLYFDMCSGTKKSCTLTFPGGSSFTFDAYISGFSLGNMDPDNMVENTTTLKIVTKPVFSAGS